MEYSILDSVKKILFDKGFHHVKPLGKGGFADVLSAISPNKEHIAVKIIKNENSWPFEERIWPTLRHKNILELLYVIDVKDLDLKLYLMPKHPFVLDKLIFSRSFLLDQNGLYRLKRWLTDSLAGLESMHTSGYAHLDIKSDNILISSEDRALLCDFSGIYMTGVPLRRLCSPLENRPPEWYDPFQNVEGASCDIWLFGLMTLQVLTGHWPLLNMRPVSDAKSWKKNAERVLLEALEQSRFFDIMEKAFPSVKISAAELFTAHDFVVSIMRWNPADRPSIQQIKCHHFLANLECRNVINAVKSDAINNVVSNPFYKGCGEPNTDDNKSLPEVELKAGNNREYASNDVKFDSMKSVVTNPFHKGWGEPETDYNKSSTEVALKVGNNQEYVTNDVKFDAIKTTVTNPFLKGWIEPVKQNENTSINVTCEEKNGRDFNMGIYNHQPCKEFEMTDEYDKDFLVCKRSNNCCASNLQHLNSDEETTTKNVMMTNKKKSGGKITKWIKKKYNQVFHKRNNYVILAEEPE